jgi:hypothetical protein
MKVWHKGNPRSTNIKICEERKITDVSRMRPVRENF